MIFYLFAFLSRRWTYILLIVETLRCSLRASVILAVSHVSLMGGKFPASPLCWSPFLELGPLSCILIWGQTPLPPRIRRGRSHTHIFNLHHDYAACTIMKGSLKSRLKLPVWKLKEFPKVKKNENKSS